MKHNGRFGLLPLAGSGILLTLAIFVLGEMGAVEPVRGWMTGEQNVPTAANVDLTAEISMTPTVPQAGQQSMVRIVVRNRSALAVTTGFYIYLYIDPPDRPPRLTTPDTYYWYLPGLAANSAAALERSHTFEAVGCNHIIYAWVDRENRVAETDETNNVISETVCVGVTCATDASEEDDTCTTARWHTIDATTHHTLCPTGDEDWIKFTATGAFTYTISATHLEPHSDPVFWLYNACGGQPTTGGGPNLSWYAPSSGIYYLQILHRRETYGPLTGYDLSITGTAGAGDTYEPDNTCAMARDIRTDGVRQTHIFQVAGDQDWVKFTVGSGETLAIVADHVGPGVNPLISLHNTCDQFNSAAIAQGSPIQKTASTAQTFYAKAINANAQVFGPTARYDLSVNALPCGGDAYEGNDSAATAKVLPVNGAPQTHTACPAGDHDWTRFSATVGTIYTLQTFNLGEAADTDLTLFDTDGTTRLAYSDDYGYARSSRIIWQCPRNGDYFLRTRHRNPAASGADTRYDLTVSTGRCARDSFEPDNRPNDAPAQPTDGTPRAHNFCPGADLAGIADQDWVRFNAVAGAKYAIQTASLQPDSDTVIEVYDHDGRTRLATNDDRGMGLASAVDFTAPSNGAYFVRVKHYNSTHFGQETGYQLAITGAAPPTATPPPSPSPTRTPSPTPTIPPSQVKTLILSNRQRLNSLFGETDATTLMNKVYALANHARVQGIVVEVDNDASVSAAYAEWIANPTAFLDNAKANAVSSAVRNLALTFLNASPNAKYILIIGDERVIPFRRVPEGNLTKTEHAYAPLVTAGTTTWAAANANLTLTDDYYADREPTPWRGHELYIPDYAIGRLVERPQEIIAIIDQFQYSATATVNQVLVTGYDFVSDTGIAVRNLFKNDNLPTDDSLIENPSLPWTGDDLRNKLLLSGARFDIQSINGHATHTSLGTPDQRDLRAAEIITGTNDLSGALIFSLSCHAGLNDSGTLDLVQAFVQKRAYFVGNTGFGWGSGGGMTYSESLTQIYARELVRGTSNTIGVALMNAKRRYWEFYGSTIFGPYDEKALMQVTLYGLPMVEVQTGGTLDPGDLFPSVIVTNTSIPAFGDVKLGNLSLGLPRSFGAFDRTTTPDGEFLSLDSRADFPADAPAQPRFFMAPSTPPAGKLHGVLFQGGTYSDVVSFDPVIAPPTNEYVTVMEPEFDAPGWYPAVPFQVRSDPTISGTTGTLLAVLGQYDSHSATERLYDRMAFATYFSSNPDTQPPQITHADGTLDVAGHRGSLKVQADDDSGVIRVVAAFTDNLGTWQSQDLAYEYTSNEWTGVITATLATYYFIQAVDGAGNVAVDDAKGEYHRFLAPWPLIDDQKPNAIYLPCLVK